MLFHHRWIVTHLFGPELADKVFGLVRWARMLVAIDPLGEGGHPQCAGGGRGGGRGGVDAPGGTWRKVKIG